MKRMWVAAAAVVVVAGAVLVYAFTAGGEPAGAPPTVTPSPRPAPTLQPLEFAAAASWTTPKGRTKVDLRDDLALVENADHLTVRDAATGAQRWQLPWGAPLPGDGGAQWRPATHDTRSRLVEHGDGLAVLTTFASVDGPARGLVLLSAVDARVLWQTELQSAGEYWDLIGVDDGIAFVVLQGGETTAISIETGKQVWTRAGWAVEVVDGTVLAEIGDDPRAPGSPGTVTALHPATGEQRWDLEAAEILATGGDTVLVRVAADQEPVGKVLAIGDGRELATVGTDIYPELCAGDGSLLACPIGADVVVTDLATGVVTSTGALVFEVDQVLDGRIHVSRGGRAWTIDGVGNVIDKDLPGTPAAMSAGLVCFTDLDTDPDNRAVSCHARTG